MEDINNISQKSNPRITVITAVLNRVGTLEKTIQSVLGQTYKNIEYIIIDGGSTDGTIDIIKRYAPRISYWISEKDKNIADGMNKGITRATGEYINFINSDDYFISNDLFERIFSTPHSADILYGSFIGNFNGNSVACSMASEKDVVGRAYQGMQLCHSAVFAKAAVLKKYKLDLGYRISPDNDFITKCVANGHTFERLNEVIFMVGAQGTSFENWLPARIENWKIARFYFPGIKTDWYHFYKLTHEVLFRAIKSVFSAVGLYQLARSFYRKKLQKKFPLLPGNIKPYNR
jgi:glycosyltransferase involved in cell wall biosynthesis